MKNSFEQTQVISGITIKFLSKTTKISGPAIFILHGRGMSTNVFMNRYPDFLEGLVEAGFILILFDLRNHGSRLLDELQNKRTGNSNHCIDMYANAYGTSCDLAQLCDVVPLYHDIQVYGVFGFSMGAHTMLSTIPRYQFPVAVSVVGCGDYLNLMRTRKQIVPSKLELLVSKIDPIQNIEKFTKTKLLMLFGNKDSLVPAESNSQFERKLKGIGNWTKQVVEGGHEFNSEMQKLALDWFKSSL